MKTILSVLALAPLLATPLGLAQTNEVVVEDFAPSDISDLDAFKQKVKVVFISYGSRELGGNRPGGRGVFGGDPKGNTEALKAAGINSYFYVSPDTAHEWQSWRRSLHRWRRCCSRNVLFRWPPWRVRLRRLHPRRRRPRKPISPL